MKKRYTLARIKVDGVFKVGGSWQLSDGTSTVKSWSWMPLPWCLTWCLLHGHLPKLSR